MKSLVPKFLRKDKLLSKGGSSERTTDTTRSSSSGGGGASENLPVFTITYSKFENASVKEYYVAAKYIREVFPECKNIIKNQVGRIPLRVLITADYDQNTYRIWQGRQQDIMKSTNATVKQDAINEMTHRLVTFRKNLEEEEEKAAASAAAAAASAAQTAAENNDNMLFPEFTITYSKFEDAGIKEYHVASKCVKEIFPKSKIQPNQVSRFPLRVTITAEIVDLQQQSGNNSTSTIVRIWQGRQQDLMKTADKSTTQNILDDLTSKLQSFQMKLEIQQQQQQQRNDDDDGDGQLSTTNNKSSSSDVAEEGGQSSSLLPSRNSNNMEGHKTTEEINNNLLPPQQQQPSTFNHNNNDPTESKLTEQQQPEQPQPQNNLPLQLPKRMISSRRRHHEDDSGALSQSLKVPTLKSL